MPRASVWLEEGIKRWDGTMGAVFSRVAALRALKSLLGARGSLLLHPSLDISFSVGWLKLERILSCRCGFKLLPWDILLVWLSWPDFCRLIYSIIYLHLRKHRRKAVNFDDKKPTKCYTFKMPAIFERERKNNFHFSEEKTETSYHPNNTVQTQSTFVIITTSLLVFDCSFSVKLHACLCKQIKTDLRAQICVRTFQWT